MGKQYGSGGGGEEVSFAPTTSKSPGSRRAPGSGLGVLHSALSVPDDDNDGVPTVICVASLFLRRRAQPLKAPGRRVGGIVKPLALTGLSGAFREAARPTRATLPMRRGAALRARVRPHPLLRR